MRARTVVDGVTGPRCGIRSGSASARRNHNRGGHDNAKEVEGADIVFICVKRRTCAGSYEESGGRFLGDGFHLSRGFGFYRQIEAAMGTKAQWLRANATTPCAIGDGVDGPVAKASMFRKEEIALACSLFEPSVGRVGGKNSVGAEKKHMEAVTPFGEAARLYIHHLRSLA